MATKADKALKDRRIGDIRLIHTTGDRLLPFEFHMANGWLTGTEIELNQFTVPENPIFHGGRYPFVLDHRHGVTIIAQGDRIRFLPGGKREVVREGHDVR